MEKPNFSINICDRASIIEALEFGLLVFLKLPE